MIHLECYCWALRGQTKRACGGETLSVSRKTDSSLFGIFIFRAAQSYICRCFSVLLALLVEQIGQYRVPCSGKRQMNHQRKHLVDSSLKNLKTGRWNARNVIYVGKKTPTQLIKIMLIKSYLGWMCHFILNIWTECVRLWAVQRWIFLSHHMISPWRPPFRCLPRHVLLKVTAFFSPHTKYESKPLLISDTSVSGTTWHLWLTGECLSISKWVHLARSLTDSVGPWRSRTPDWPRN